MGQETGRGVAGGYEGNFQTLCWQIQEKGAAFFRNNICALHLGVAAAAAGCVCFNTSCHMHLEGTEMHGDFTGGVGSMAWLGFRGGGGFRGTDTGDRMHLDGI